MSFNVLSKTIEIFSLRFDKKFKENLNTKKAILDSKRAGITYWKSLNVRINR